MWPGYFFPVSARRHEARVWLHSANLARYRREACDSETY